MLVKKSRKFSIWNIHSQLCIIHGYPLGLFTTRFKSPTQIVQYCAIYLSKQAGIHSTVLYVLYTTVHVVLFCYSDEQIKHTHHFLSLIS
jgi:hypothetical protein